MVEKTAPAPGTLMYIAVQGTVAGKKVDLRIGVPVEELLDQAPTFLARIETKMPAFIAAIESFAERVKKLAE